MVAAFFIFLQYLNMSGLKNKKAKDNLKDARTSGDNLIIPLLSISAIFINKNELPQIIEREIRKNQDLILSFNSKGQ